MKNAPPIIVGIIIIAICLHSYFRGKAFRGYVPNYIQDENLKQKIGEGVRKRYYERMKRIRDKADLLRLSTSPIEFTGFYGDYKFRYEDLIISWVDGQKFIIRFRDEIVYVCEFGEIWVNSFGRLTAFRNDILGWQELFDEMESVFWDYYNMNPKLIEKRKLDPERFG